MKILFKNAKILDLNLESGYKIGDVLVVEDKIAYVGNKCTLEYDKIIDVNGNILSPGFVNAHSHSPMTIFRGLKDDVSLDEWLFDNILPLEKKLTEEDVYYGTMLAICEYLRAGITTVQEFYSFEKSIIKAFEDGKFRASVGMGILKADNTQNNLNIETLNLINKTKNLKPVCTAHSIYGVNEEYLEEIVTFAKQNNLPLSIHLSETLKEVGDCSVKYNLTPPQYLEQLGFFDRKCTCYHCVHMDKDDLQILADYNVNVVTCPSSNIKLASGIAPIYAMQNKNINIAIGTDGPASNNSLDMFKEMFLVATLSKVNIYNSSAVTVRDVLKMATINGAKALDFEDIGEIKVGKKADLILIDTTKPHMQPCANVLSNLVYSAKSSDVYLTMINGEILYENGKLNLPISEMEIINKVNKIRERIV